MLTALTGLLRSCTGNPTLPAPVRLLRTRWVTHPLHRGTYSYCGMSTEAPRHQVALAEPVAGGRVLFARKATDLEW